MSTHKSIDRICCVVIVLALILSCAAAFAKNLGLQSTERTLGYETRLFNTDTVHTIDIEMDDWDSFLASCEDEAYAACTVVIDNEAKKNVAIRAKGNTSLSNVAQLGSQRYSFKIEFDHYESGKTYYGLDKLSLNNLIQDNTMMKDYLTYSMMREFGVNAPLCSFVYLTVNGEDWGMYLAVEGVEDAFLSRNYNSQGNLYKPDSMSMGGGRGNGRDFEMEWDESTDSDEAQSQNGDTATNQAPAMANGGNGQMQPPDMSSGEMPEMSTTENGEMPQMPNGGSGQMQPPDMSSGEMPEMPDMENGEMPEMPGGQMNPGGMGGGQGDMNGSADVKLQYIDDDPDSYANIFDNAKTDITDSDKTRLIASLKALSEKENLSEIVDIDAVIRYFVVHDFVCNGDSYTGSMIHNYYLYENDGQLSMIPWDYNLAFGGFQSFQATSTVNEPIDSPVSNGDVEDRPMAAWIFDDGEYQELYHELYARFLDEFDFEAFIQKTEELIAPYVEKDPSKFCTYEEFETGVQTLIEFCKLREQSVEGQLDGSIPSTTEGQNEDGSSLIDASSITITDMGSMQAGMGGGDGMQNFAPNGGMQNQMAPDAQSQEASGEEAIQQPQPADSGEAPVSSDETQPTDEDAAAQQPQPADTGEAPVSSDETQPTNEDAAAQQPQNGQMPNNPMSGEMGGGKQPSFDGNPGGANQQMPEFGGEGFPGEGGTFQMTTQTWILLGACILVLLLGLLGVRLYRRRA